MVGIDRLVVIIGMAISAIGWRTGIARRVTLNAIRGRMTSGQWEGRGVVVEDKVTIAGGVAGQASYVIVTIAIYTIVLIVRLWVGMTICTSEH